MRQRVSSLCCVLAFVSVSVTAQVSYWFQGFQRSGNAPIARAYLGVGGYVTNWFTTNAPGSIVPIYLLPFAYTNSTDLAGLIVGWGVGTNTTDKMPTNFYKASTDLAGVINGNTIGTNTSDKTPTNFYNNANTVLLPGVVSGSSVGTNYASLIYVLPANVLTNNRTVATTLSNILYLTIAANNPQLYFLGTSGTIGFGNDIGTAVSYLSFGTSSQIQAFKDLVAQSDNGIDLGASAHRWKNLYVGSNIWMVGAFPVAMFSNNVTGLYAAITNGTLTANGIVIPSVTTTNPPIQLRSGNLAPDSSLLNGLIAGAIEYSNHTFFATTYKVRRSIALAQDVVVTNATSINTNITVTNTLSETTIYTISMAANYLTPGKCFEPRLNGVYTLNNPQTFTIRAKMNGVTLLTVTSTTSSANQKPWEAYFMFTCTGVGANGSLEAFSKLTQDTTANCDELATPAAIDTTAANTMTITVQHSSTGNGLTLKQGRTLCVDFVPGQ